VVLGGRLDSVILEVFSNLGFYESVSLAFLSVIVLTFIETLKSFEICFISRTVGTVKPLLCFC